MPDDAILVHDLSKRYALGVKRHDTLRDRIVHGARNWLRKTSAANVADEFWALQDVNFAVKRGEVLGIVGRNGAGKSTLLKLLSRITEPTRGSVTLRGRVASLLEVGTGFHPELTGRENIFLNGAILGMTRAEIGRKFDAIVSFAEVARFLDTPVKHYSSGMYVRLAFAVAAHLEPEILIIDEVLAVGDDAFQKKCLGKMREVATSDGRTILFVSHNAEAVRQLCSRAILLNAGRLTLDGTPHEVLGAYLGDAKQAHAVLNLDEWRRGNRTDNTHLQRLLFKDDSGRPLTTCRRGDSIHLEIAFEVNKSVDEFDIAIAILLPDGTRLFSELWSDVHPRRTINRGAYLCRLRIPARFLRAGGHLLTLAALSSGRLSDLIEGIPLPEVTDPGSDPFTESHRWGSVRVPVEWAEIEPA